jgi:hypothetical protein
MYVIGLTTRNPSSRHQRKRPACRVGSRNEAGCSPRASAPNIRGAHVFFGLGDGSTLTLTWGLPSRVSAKTSTASSLYREDFIEEVVAELGADKVLFGSQSPLLDQDLELHRILWAHTDDEVKQTVMWDNAQKLFGSS